MYLLNFLVSRYKRWAGRSQALSLVCSLQIQGNLTLKVVLQTYLNHHREQCHILQLYHCHCQLFLHNTDHHEESVPIIHLQSFTVELSSALRAAHASGTSVAYPSRHSHSLVSLLQDWFGSVQVLLQSSCDVKVNYDEFV